MTDFLRIVLILALAGAAVTVAAAWMAWWNDEERRLSRIVRRTLGDWPDAQIIARGRNAAAAFRLASDQVLVMWNGGAKALLYPLSALLGAELLVDEAVVVRVYRGEPRRALEAINTAARDVTLRLLFDNPRDPEFELDLMTGGNDVAQAIREARSWIARADAIIRRPIAPTVMRQAGFDEEDEDEAPF